MLTKPLLYPSELRSHTAAAIACCQNLRNSPAVLLEPPRTRIVPVRVPVSASLPTRQGMDQCEFGSDDDESATRIVSSDDAPRVR